MWLSAQRAPACAVARKSGEARIFAGTPYKCRMAPFFSRLGINLRGRRLVNAKIIRPALLFAFPQRLVQPPSTIRFSPVTYAEASEARNTTAPWMSSLPSMRPSGTRLQYWSTNGAGW